MFAYERNSTAMSLSQVFSVATVDDLTEEAERRSVLCTVCADILSQLDDSEEHVKSLRREMLSDEQIPDAKATLRYDKHAIGTKGTVSPWLIRALAARALGDTWSDVQGRQATENKMLEFLQHYVTETKSSAFTLLDVYSMETAESLCKLGNRTRKSLPEFCIAALLILKQLKGDTTEQQGILDMMKNREKEVANRERAQKREQIPGYSEYLKLADELTKMDDWGALRMRDRSMRTWALLQILVLPTREKTLQPYQVSPKINGKPVLRKYDGLVFQPMKDYKVSEQKEGATLLFNDGPVSTWEIILGDHTAENLKKTKHKFAVRVPLKPMFDECTECFDFLAKLLKTRLEEVESKPGALVFGTHLKTHGVGKNGFQKYWKEDLKTPTDIGGFRSSVEQYAEDLFQAKKISVSRRAGIHAICQHTAKTAYSAYCNLQGDASGNESDDTNSVTSDTEEMFEDVEVKIEEQGQAAVNTDEQKQVADSGKITDPGPTPTEDEMAEIDSVVDDLMLESPRTDRIATALFKYNRKHGRDPPMARLLYHAIEAADERRKRRRAN